MMYASSLISWMMAFRPRVRSRPSASYASPVWCASQQSSSTSFTRALLPSGIQSCARISAFTPPTPPQRSAPSSSSGGGDPSTTA